MTPTSTPSTASPSTALRGAIVCVASVGLLSTLGSLIWSRGNALSVGSGALVAVVHLLAVAYGVTRALNGERLQVSWVLAALMKFVVLFAGFAWLARSGVVSVLPFLAGYAAMPLGIVLAQVSPIGLSAAAKEFESSKTRIG
jgi:hypothetical protein